MRRHNWAPHLSTQNTLREFSPRHFNRQHDHLYIPGRIGALQQSPEPSDLCATIFPRGRHAREIRCVGEFRSPCLDDSSRFNEMGRRVGSFAFPARRTRE